MGADKANLPFGRGTLIEHIVSAGRSGAQEVIISMGAAPRDFPSAMEGFPKTLDAFDGKGPLAGLESIMAAAGVDWVLALPCDMPWVDETLLARLLEAVRQDPLSDGAVFATAGTRHAFPMVIHRRMREVVRRRLTQDKNSVLGPSFEGRFLEIDLNVDEANKVLTNLNNPADLARARIHFAKSSTQGEDEGPIRR